MKSKLLNVRRSKGPVTPCHVASPRDIGSPRSAPLPLFFAVLGAQPFASVYDVAAEEEEEEEEAAVVVVGERAKPVKPELWRVPNSDQWTRDEGMDGSGSAGKGEPLGTSTWNWQ